MNSIILILPGILALASATSLPGEFITKPFPNVSNVVYDNIANEEIFIEGRSFKGLNVLSSNAEKAIKQFLDQMPFGFPDHGIPVLAPLVMESFTYQLKKSFAEISLDLEDIRIEGLNDMLINHLEVTYVFSQKITYNFTFPRIVASGKYNSDSTFDLIKEFGISVRHYGQGDFEVILENLTLQGYFKYTMPIVYGSISIYNFEGSVTLENLLTNVEGLAGESKFNQLINDKMEEFGLKFVRSQQELINNMVKEFLIPLANKKFDGKNVWSLIG